MAVRRRLRPPVMTFAGNPSAAISSQPWLRPIPSARHVHIGQVRVGHAVGIPLCRSSAHLIDL
jgi:hypothetical protein